MCKCTMVSRITAKKLLTIIMIFLNGQDQKLDCRSFFLMTIQTIIDRHASRWKNGGQMLKTAKWRAGDLRSMDMVNRWYWLERRSGPCWQCGGHYGSCRVYELVSTKSDRRWWCAADGDGSIENLLKEVGPMKSKYLRWVRM